jgi:hypothetical protein
MLLAGCGCDWSDLFMPFVWGVVGVFGLAIGLTTTNPRTRRFAAGAVIISAACCLL